MQRREQVQEHAMSISEVTQVAPVPEDDLDAHLDAVIAETGAALADLRQPDGHLVFELEADATIPAEYIMLEHYLDDIDPAVEAKLAVYLRRTQNPEGGWPLFHGGETDISATVKAYFALKLAGDDIDAPHMRKARDLILAMGGAARANVFTRIALALFGQVPWGAVPCMPVEAMLLPRWFPFHVTKVSYWSRTVMVPLFVLMALKPQARNPRCVDIRELFITPPEQERDYMTNPTGSAWGRFFLTVDKVLRRLEPRFPKSMRERAIARAMRFTTERLNGEDGLGAIYPAMANAVMAFDALGYPRDHPDFRIAMDSIRKLLVLNDDEGYCQPCVSPVWDTSLAAHALMEARHEDAAVEGCDWLQDRQILDLVGDWEIMRPGLRPGGWAFQYRNDYYPDVDDTAVVAMALHRADPVKYRENIDRAVEWVRGMQSSSGGWGAFDIDNEWHILNHIPFADHGALLDPPTADVSARCVSMLAQICGADDAAVRRGLDYLRDEQEDDGSWFGRWGTNYVYGTWSVLCAFNACGIGSEDPAVARAVAWLKSRQRPDGGWGEGGETYYDHSRDFCAESTPSQTAWAVLGLMAVGEADSPEVRRGIAYLLAAERDGAKWREPWFTAVGFPRVFYLRYHGYSAYFPVWALARYRNLIRGNVRVPQYGM